MGGGGGGGQLSGDCHLPKEKFGIGSDAQTGAFFIFELKFSTIIVQKIINLTNELFSHKNNNSTCRIQTTLPLGSAML